MKEVENLQKRALRFVQNDYHSCYETLLHKSRKTNVNVQDLRHLCKEIFKSLKNLNPVFLPKINQVSFGTKCLRGLVLKI